MRALGIILILAAAGIFYGCFFMLAPWIANSIPAGDWQHFIRIIVYVVIGWIGGIGIPIGLLISGIVCMFMRR